MTVVFGRCTKEIAIVCYLLARHFARMYRVSGRVNTALYMRMCALALIQSLSSDSTSFTYIPSKKLPMVSLSRKGLPRVIPARHRHLMLSDTDRGRFLIQLSLTFFNLYRVINAYGKFDEESIVRAYAGAPFRQEQQSEEIPLLGKLYKELLSGSFFRWIPEAAKVPLLQRFSRRISWASGPNSKRGETSITCLHMDASCFIYQMKLEEFVFTMPLLVTPRVIYPFTAGRPAGIMSGV